MSIPNKQTKQERILKWVTFGFTLASIAGFLSQANDLFNYENAFYFLIITLLIGLALGLIALRFMRILFNFTFNNETTREIHYLVLSFFAVSIIGVSNLTNIKYRKASQSCSLYNITEIKIINKKRSNRISRFVIQAKRNNEIRIISIPSEEWNSLKISDEVEICDCIGFWGFKYYQLVK